MLSFFSHFPKQVRAQDAIKKLNSYFELQGNTEKEPLPSMTKIVDYSIRHPRLLRIRDSPLRILHDPNLPYAVVHDWYTGIALDYLETSLFVLLERWESSYRKKRHDSRQVAEIFLETVNDIYQCYEHTGLPLAFPFPEGSALGSLDLKEKVKHASIALIKEKIQPSFNDARDTFYILALKYIEALFRMGQIENDLSFAYLFSPKINKYKDMELEKKAQLIIDTNLPRLVDVFSLSDSILEDVSFDSPSNDENNSISTDSWLVDDEEIIQANFSIEILESNIQNFNKVCEQLNNLKLSPDWTCILKEIIKQRLSLPEWIDDWEISLVKIQLKWLHVLILPWISYVMPNTDDIDINWKNFLRDKIKAEHVLYEMIYQLRIPKIFDIIREYPTTRNAILDFHIVATKRGLLKDLKDRLITELQSRLLHQGASSTDILQQYIACIHCLSIIDPTCDIMVSVIELVENYMRIYRKDVVEGVVSLIRDYSDEEILKHADEDYIYTFEQSDICSEEVPRDVIIVKEDRPAILSSLQKKSRDPIAMLISICSSLNDFIEGYSDKLGEVLLSSKNYDIDTEVRRLELLKRHFPPDVFTRCDIMLKDMDDSRRLDKFIHTNSGIEPSLHAIILSKKYWPGGEDDSDDEDSNNNSQLELWMNDKLSTTEYDYQFRRTKANRRLKFLHSKGTVSLNLEFKSKNLKVDVRPEALPIISLFETKEDSYTRQEIIEKVGLDKYTVVDCLEFWMKQDVLEITADGHYRLTEE